MTDTDKKKLMWMGAAAAVVLGGVAIYAWKHPGTAHFVTAGEAKAEDLRAFRKMFGRNPTAFEQSMRDVQQASDGRGGLNLAALRRM